MLADHHTYWKLQVHVSRHHNPKDFELDPLETHVKTPLQRVFSPGHLMIYISCPKIIVPHLFTIVDSASLLNYPEKLLLELRTAIHLSTINSLTVSFFGDQKLQFPEKRLRRPSEELHLIVRFPVSFLSISIFFCFNHSLLGTRVGKYEDTYGTYWEGTQVYFYTK